MKKDLILDNKKLLDIVNKSGFPLQLAIDNEISGRKNFDWQVALREHAWNNSTNGESGFIDLVISNKANTQIFVMECKRVLESNWIFIVPKKNKPRRHIRCWVTDYTYGGVNRFGWADVRGEPCCIESDFCVLLGQNEKARPMIERVASYLVSSTEALAREERLIFGDKGDCNFKTYFNIIITTADLKVCYINPDEISLNDGMVQDANFESVPYVRYRKQLTTVHDITSEHRKDGYYALSKAKESTVFVVNANHLIDFLSNFILDSSCFNPFAKP